MTMKLSDKELMRAASRQSASRPRGECLDEEVLAAFAEDCVSPEVYDAALAHAARCRDCADVLFIVRAILEEPEAEAAVRVPLKLLIMAKKLDPAAESVMEVVIRFAKGAAEVLRMSAGVVEGLVPVPEALRGEGQVVSDTLVTFQKRFPPYLAEVEVERVKANRGELTVRLLDQETGGYAEGVRVSLFEKDREVESEVVHEGTAVFENLKFGQYRVEITMVGEPIGRITVEMKGEGQ